MDVHEFLSVPIRKQTLETWHQMLVEAQKRSGERPRIKASRHELVENYLRVREKKGSELKPELLIATPAYPPCTTSLDKLSKVMIDDLRLETHHRGSYVLLRSIVPPDRNAAVFSIVEDEKGSVLNVSLHNKTKDRAPNEILGEGTVFIVKEPYLKLTANESYVLRVDHVTDLVYLSIEDPLMPTAWRQTCHDEFVNASDIKDKGNEHFHKGRYYAAIDSYTKALDRDPTEEEICALKLNRSLALLKTSQLESALSDIDSILGVSKQTEKTLLHKHRILYEMQQYRSCCEVLKLLLSKFPDNKTAKDELNRAIERVAEQEKGRYRFEKMQDQTTTNRPPYLDNATYVGPVSIQPAGLRGRGLFTTKEVKAGELLLAEKAFAYTYIDKEESTENLFFVINPETSKITLAGQVSLRATVIQKLQRRPSLISEITQLYHEPYRPVEASDADGPVIDSFLLERILQLNAFGCPLSTCYEHAMQIEKKANMNLEVFKSCGIWKMASYINHSCIMNARRSFIGDVMIVRASRDIPTNTEILFQYKEPHLYDHGELPRKLQDWNFKCGCSLCEARSKTTNSIRNRRKTLLTDAMRLCDSGKLASVESILKNIQKTYAEPTSEVPRLELMEFQRSLAVKYLMEEQLVKAVETAIKALQSLGFVIKGGDIPHVSGVPVIVEKWGQMTDFVIDYWVVLTRSYRSIAPELEAQAKAYLKICYKICVGEDETFELVYGGLLA